jgi:hypothetical protein
VAVPEEEWTARRTRFAAYRALVGTELTVADWARATAAERDRVCGSLAEVLVAMHTALADAEAAALGVPTALIRDWDGFRPGSAAGAVCGRGGAAADLVRRFPGARRRDGLSCTRAGSSGRRRCTLRQ